MKMDDRSAPMFPRLRLRVTVSASDWLGPGKADLLMGIAETGSIAAAGRRMGMSYKRAWGLVEVLNAMFAQPMVIANRGGADHGGASLTETGHEVLRLYATMLRKADSALSDEVAQLGRLMRGSDMSDGK